jgi:aminoglycoside phosphotransferase (APT) family kinase protein
MSVDVAALADIVAGVLPGAGPVAIEGLARIHGGASRETWRFDAVRGEDRHGLILRRDPAASLIDTDRRVEFAAYRSFENTDVPVPRALLLEETPGRLGAPFFLMERIDNASAMSPFQPGAYGVQAEAISRQFFHALGRIAARDVAAAPLTAVLPTSDEPPWRRELAHWAQVVATDALEPQPIAQAAIRRLKRTPPPTPQRLAIVHGDYRSGNFMQDGAGRIVAVLDWEMAHLGDPLEDLAWALDPLWSHGDPDRPLGGVPRAEAIAIWEAASGLTADPQALSWWSLFASLKGLAIWISAGEAYARGANADPVNGFSSWFCTAFHNDLIARRLTGAAA